MALYFAKQPSSITTREGYRAVFSVQVNDTVEYDNVDNIPEITYKWYASSDGGAQFTEISNTTSTTSMLILDDVRPDYNNNMYKCVATNGTYTVESVVVLLIVISNEDITSNFTMEYTSRFTGEEIDEAIRKFLGEKYDTRIVPGTRLIGRYGDEAVDLNDLDLPGVYTAHFYIHAPNELENTNGTTPIQISVYTSEDYASTGQVSLFQTIVTIAYADQDIPDARIEAGQSLYYLFFRDIADPETPITDANQNYGWNKLLLSNGNLTVINNLLSNDPNASLSANMGRYLKKLIDEDAVGGFNNLASSGPRVHPDSEKYNTFGFSDVWKQRVRESPDGTIIDSDSIGGRRLFDYTTNPSSGKMENDDGLKTFNPITYFDRYLSNDYLTINTTRTTQGNSDDPHPAGFNSKGTYGFMTKDSADMETLAMDTAYTASVWVKREAGSSDSKVFVRLHMCRIATSQDNTIYHDVLPVDKFVINDHEYQTIETDSGDITGYTSETYSDVSTVKPCTTGEFPVGKWVKISATIQNADYIMAQCRQGAQRYDADNHPVGEPLATFEVSHVKMSFGVIGNATVQFKNFKLERGKVATDGAMTLAEMWSEFDNANYLRTIPIDKDVNMLNLDEQQGLIFTKIKNDPLSDTTRGRWVRKYIATGGGGGFVVQATPPTQTEVLWYVWPNSTDDANIVNSLDSNGYVTTTSSTGVSLKHYKGAFYYYTSQGYGSFDSNGRPVLTGAGWYPAESNYEMGNTPPANIFKLWLDTNNGKYNQNESPDLKYYDTKWKTWRIVGAEARPCWVIQDTPPVAPDDDLMWITTSGIASVPYTRQDGTKVWLPIQAIWGKND